MADNVEVEQVLQTDSSGEKKETFSMSYADIMNREKLYAELVRKGYTSVINITTGRWKLKVLRNRSPCHLNGDDGYYEEYE